MKAYEGDALAFVVTYDIDVSSRKDAQRIVDAMCLENTVGLEESLVPPGTWINENVVGKCLDVRERRNESHNKTFYSARVRYHDETSGGELTGLINVIFGSAHANVRVADVELSENMLAKFQGPRFGVKGLRKLLGVERGAIVMTALKPMGTPSEKLAEMCYAFARGGIDIIKDDHGLANQRYAPFEERVRMCCAAVRRANEQTGRKCIYAPCINAPAHLVVARAKFAKAAGAGAVLMIPGLTGLDSMRVLAEDPGFGLPIIAHPAILGAMLGGGTRDEIRGFSHGVLLGLLPRLAGADATIFPSFGGRFGFSVDECKDIVHGSRRPLGHYPAILPAPGGGMTLDKVKTMMDTYSQDVILLIGGSLYSHSSDLTANARHILAIAGRADLYGPKETPYHASPATQYHNHDGTPKPKSDGTFTPGSGMRPKLKLASGIPEPYPTTSSPYPTTSSSYVTTSSPQQSTPSSYLTPSSSYPTTPQTSYLAAPPPTPMSMDPEAIKVMSALKEKNAALESKIDELTVLVKHQGSQTTAPQRSYPAAAPSTPMSMDPEAIKVMSALKDKNTALESKIDELTVLVKHLMTEKVKGGSTKHASTGPLEGNHSKVLNRKDGEFQWERVPQEMYKMDGASFKNCSRIELIGKRGESPCFHVRYFEVAPGGWTTLEHHQHEHVVIALRGEGEVQLGLEAYPLSLGDVAYTAPGDVHQLRCKPDAKDAFGFICVVAADRDRPVEDEPYELLKSCKLAHVLDDDVRVALETQVKHRIEHKTSHAAVADGSACEWKPGMKKNHDAAASAVAQGSACEFTPKSKVKPAAATPRRYFP